MALTPAQNITLSELSEHLYNFLPGQAHPFADPSISFAGVAADLDLHQFWPAGSKQPAIFKLLSGTLEYRPERFSSLILEIVQRGIPYRQNKGTPITREEIERLNYLVACLGFKIPELHDPEFLRNLPRAAHISTDERPDVPPETFQRLKKELMELSGLPPQERGYRFEKFLADMFEAFGMAPRTSFRLAGEQIDGSFHLQGDTYLVEAKWQNAPVSQEALLVFSGKVGSKAEWSRGLFISYSGFTRDGLETFARGRRINIICMDGADLWHILHGGLDLRTVIERKARYAAETNQAYVSVRDLFPEIPLT